MIVANMKPRTAAGDLETGRTFMDCRSVQAKNPSYNAVTLAALTEAKNMAEGRIPGKRLSSIEEVRKELGFTPHGI